jgi:hypothetical protein
MFDREEYGAIWERKVLMFDLEEYGAIWERKVMMFDREEYGAIWERKVFYVCLRSLWCHFGETSFYV